MYKLVVVISCLVAMATGQSPIQGLKVPPGSRVEVDVEFVTRNRPPMPMATGSRMAGPSSVTQQLLTNMAQLSLGMRRMANVPVPVLEEPCPCDAECCQRPMEPRRLVPVLHLPMASHIGCCGCIDCPVSAYPMVSYMIMSAVMTDQAKGTPTMGPS